MLLDPLTDDGRAFVLRCFRAVQGGLLPAPRLHTLTGVHPHELDEIVAAWPEIDGHPKAELALNNVLLNLDVFPHARQHWEEWFAEPRSEPRRLFEKWRAGRGRPVASRHFDARE